MCVFTICFVVLWNSKATQARKMTSTKGLLPWGTKASFFGGKNCRSVEMILVIAVLLQCLFGVPRASASLAAVCPRVSGCSWLLAKRSRVCVMLHSLRHSLSAGVSPAVSPGFSPGSPSGSHPGLLHTPTTQNRWLRTVYRGSLPKLPKTRPNRLGWVSSSSRNEKILTRSWPPLRSRIL